MTFGVFNWNWHLLFLLEMALQGARCFSSGSLGLDFAAPDGESEARFCSCFPLLVNIGEVLEHRALSS